MPFIYAIKNRTTDLVYYGSTTKSIQKRFSVHKAVHREGRQKLTAFKVLACPTAYIELVEEVSVEDQKVRERWWIENNPCVNIQRPNGTYAEWYARNRERLIAKACEYQRINKDEVNRRARERLALLRS